MAELLLLNPRKRRRSAAKKTRRARRRNPIAAVAAVSRRRRRRNPIAAVARRRTRRRNPIALRRASRRMSRRRRNPIGGGLSVKGLMRTLTDAAVMGAGAIAVDMAMAQANKFLPATLQPVPGRLSAGDAIKAVLTAALGAVLNRPTRGLAGKAAMGSLVVQARDVAGKLLAQAGMPIQGVGYYTPGMVIDRTARVGPNRALNNNGAGFGVGAYLPPGRTPLLNGAGAYLPPGRTPLLNGVARRGSSADREGVRYK